MPQIRLKPTQDGTYTVCRGSYVLMAGLTRVQAESFLARAAA